MHSSELDLFPAEEKREAVWIKRDLKYLFGRSFVCRAQETLPLIRGLMSGTEEPCVRRLGVLKNLVALVSCGRGQHGAAIPGGVVELEDRVPDRVKIKAVAILR